MRLFHFSDEPDIAVFEPRPIRVHVDRPPGQDWLNGPLVWAIDEDHEQLYLFPRECPRIVIWPTPATTEADRRQWFGGTPRRAVAYIEQTWLERLRACAVYRYELPSGDFEDLDDAGMWVSRKAASPIRVERLSDLPAQMKARDIELRVLETLAPLKGIWETSLHASGIRLRNAQHWGKPGWTHSKPGRPVRL